MTRARRIEERQSTWPVTAFASAITFLRHELNVPSRRVADAFRTSESNVNTVRSRGAATVGDPRLPFLLNPQLRYSDPIRFEETYGIQVSAQKKYVKPLDIERREREHSDIVATYKGSQDYIQGAAELKRFRAKIGRPSHHRLFRLIALTEASRCWFLSHSGFGVSALKAAARAISLLDYLYKSDRDNDLLAHMLGCYISASNASLLRRRPAVARMLLERTKHLLGALGQEPRWEWFRQQGTASFQENDLNAARGLFSTTIKLVDEADLEIHGCPGRRHLLLISPLDWEESIDLLRKTEIRLRRRSLEFSVQLHWLVASGLMIDSPAARQNANELLAQAPVPIFSSFGHQATISHLLHLTPRLLLSNTSQARWLRFLMYENAFRNC